MFFTALQPPLACQTTHGGIVSRAVASIKGSNKILRCKLVTAASRGPLQVLVNQASDISAARWSTLASFAGASRNVKTFANTILYYRETRPLAKISFENL
jgi:hypothetical protein